MAFGQGFTRNVVLFAGGAAALAVAGTSASAPPPDAADDAISQAYASKSGILGKPKGGVIKVLAWNGRYQVYDNGAIYWNKSIGARTVVGGFYNQYLNRGGPDGALGLPITDALSRYAGVG